MKLETGQPGVAFDGAFESREIGSRFPQRDLRQTELSQQAAVIGGTLDRLLKVATSGLDTSLL